MAQQTPNEVICRYIEDAIAAETAFESQLRTGAKEAELEEVRAIFAQHADETKRQHERLTARLEALGGKPSGAKSFLAHVFGFAPKPAQMGHDRAERTTQDLIAAFAVENSEIAMYESLANAASAAGDTLTEALAREIQQEERMAAEKVWNMIPTSARQAFSKVTSGESRQAA